MRRRTLLASVTGSLTALAGCNGFGAGPSGRTGTREPFSVPTTTRGGTPESGTSPLRARAVSTLRAPPVELAIAAIATTSDRLRYRVGFTEDGTRKHPPRVWIEATNTGATPTTFQFDGVAPFGAFVGTFEARTASSTATGSATPAQPPLLLLVPTDDDRFDVAWAWETDGCWRLPAAVRAPTATESVALNPGERTGREYDLVTPAGEDCLVPGVYRFRAEDHGATFTVSLWESRPSPTSRFSSVAVPDLPACATRWFHDADGDIYLEPTSESVTTPIPLRVTLYDLSTHRVVPTAVQVFKLVDGAWIPLLPTTGGKRPDALLPGQSAQRTIRLGVEPGSVHARDALPGLRTGRYAVHFGTYRDVETTRCVAAVLDVTADPVAVTPSPFVVETTRTGRRLDVETTTAGDDHPSTEESATIELGRAPSADPSTTFIVEQVFQRQALRDTLANLHDDETLDTVRLTTTARAVAQVLGPATATGDGDEGPERPLTFGFDGTVYQVRRVRPEPAVRT
ncbi:hypothetical protein [Haloarchaeobius sp. DT45]|uniref:hypothetical protein n=1 Tax=Haloarchaeobius sp. DT45 TaxID=3446116 RepID=UPI003F6CE2C3